MRGRKSCLEEMFPSTLLGPGRVALDLKQWRVPPLGSRSARTFNRDDTSGLGKALSLEKPNLVGENLLSQAKPN
jgi:hypothetical protein